MTFEPSFCVKQVLCNKKVSPLQHGRSEACTTVARPRSKTLGSQIFEGLHLGDSRSFQDGEYTRFVMRFLIPSYCFGVISGSPVTVITRLGFIRQSACGFLLGMHHLCRTSATPSHDLSKFLILQLSDWFCFCWQGMELYPRIGPNFDIKVFTNCGFGMMSWAVLIVSYAVKQVFLYLMKYVELCTCNWLLELIGQSCVG